MAFSGPASLQHSILDQEPFADFDFATLPKSDQYKLLASVVLPRPIAWVVTRDDGGGLNAAPFSFFNVISADPPLIALGFSRAPDREGKDTLYNIRERKQFVVNLVPEELLEAMNVTAANAPRGVDETELAGLALADSIAVEVPRIAGSPVALECELFQEIPTEGTYTVLLARILYLHVRQSAFEDLNRLHIDASRMRLVGRMHGAGGYCTTRDTFSIERQSWPLTPAR